MLSTLSGLSAAFATGRSSSAHPPSGAELGSAFFSTNRNLAAARR